MSGLRQVPVEELPERLWDAVVVGAGPAGSACAVELARQGRAVVLVDRERFPRDKVCGGGLIADAVASLKQLGLWEEVRAAGLPLGAVALYSPSQIEVRARGEYLTVKRAVLDAILAQRATDLGASFCHGKVGGLRVNQDQTVTALSDRGTAVRARTAVLATGARLALPEGLGMVRRRASPPEAVALCRQIRSPIPVDCLVASFDRSVLPGYAWIFPHGDGEFNVGCGIFHRSARRSPPNLRQTFDAFVQHFPLAAEVMRRAEPLGPLRGAPLRCGLRAAQPLGPGPILCAGETVGTTFPFTGEGIGKALESGRMAADAVHRALNTGGEEALRSYPERIERELRPKYKGYGIAEAWVRWPWLIDFMARRVKKSRYLQRAASGILKETTDPRQIFSVNGILRSLRP